jgi:hypothetical protein
METNLGLSEVKVLRVEDLRTPRLFVLDVNTNLIRRRSSKYESGDLYYYTIRDFKKLRSKGDIKYRGTCTLEVKVGEGEVINFKCNISSLLVYRILNNKEKYLDYTFVSYNTTPEYTCNPLKLVKCKDGSYALYSVTEGGMRYYTVTLPGGKEVQKCDFINNKREYYQRYYDGSI